MTQETSPPVGAPVPGWTPRPRPPRAILDGRHCRLEPLDPARHAAPLFAALGPATANWTYLTNGPFADLESFRAYLEPLETAPDPVFYVIVDAASGQPAGYASYLRIEPRHGTIEVGNINLGPALQRSRAATEAMALMMGHAFDDLGYRRYEWKCDSLNAPSRAAAARLGFRYEGLFRQAMVNKGRNRDTAWFSIIDSEWPALKAAFGRWLDPANFDAAGRQRERLSDLTTAARASVAG